jgi:hypothetical protein
MNFEALDLAQLWLSIEAMCRMGLGMNWKHTEYRNMQRGNIQKNSAQLSMRGIEMLRG